MTPSIAGTARLLHVIEVPEADAPVKVRDAVADAPAGPRVVVPAGWKLDATGVYRADLNDPDDLEVARITTAPVVLTERHKDIADGAESVTVAWPRDGKWRLEVVNGFDAGEDSYTGKKAVPSPRRIWPTTRQLSRSAL